MNTYYKKYLTKIILAITVLSIVISPFCFVEPAQATVDPTNFNHVIPFTITDTSGVARTNVPVIITYDVNNRLVLRGYTNATATNTYVDSSGAGNNPIGSGTAYSYLMATSNITAFIPSLPAYGSVTLNLYTGYSPLTTSFPIILGNGGYFTVADNAALECGSNYTNNTTLYLNTDTSTNLKIIYSHTNNSGNSTGGVICNVNPYTAQQIDLNVLGGGYYMYYNSANSTYGHKDAAVTFPAVGNTISIDAAFYVSSLTGTSQCIIGCGEPNLTVQLLITTTGTVNFAVGRSADFDFATSWLSNSAISTGTWHYITAVYDNLATTRTNVYLDGVAIAGAEFGLGGTIDSPNTFLSIGAGRTGGAYGLFYNGFIDEVRVSNNARTLTENQAFYYGGLSRAFSADANTISLWHFNEGSGNPIDTTGANNLTLTASPNSPEWRAGAVYTFAAQHTYAGVTTGAHNIISGLYSGNLTISVDSVQTVTAYAGSIPNSTSDWLFINNYLQSFVSYASSIRQNISGVQQLYFEPNALISGTTLPNRGTLGATGNGVITWGTNSGITVTGGDIMTSSSATVIGTNNAQFQANLEYMGTFTSLTLSFQYGTTTTYSGGTIGGSIVAVAGTYTLPVTGLSPNTTYHYRAVAQLGSVFAYGADISFTTLGSTASGGSTNPTINTVNVFRNYISTNDTLLVADISCSYPPYFPNSDPAQYFQVQLCAPNLIVNGDMEIGNPPDNWDVLVPGTFAQSLVAYSGSYSGFLGKTGSLGSPTYKASQSLPSAVPYLGSTLTAYAWVKSSSVNTWLEIYDGVGFTIGSSYSGSGNWEKLSVTRTINPAATIVTLELVVDGVSQNAYFDNVEMVSGTPILGSSPLRNWYERPESIYFNPSYAMSSIVWGSAYRLRLTNNVNTSGVDVNYTLTSSDWKEYDLSVLDSWCIQTAKSMEISDQVATGTYVTNTTGQGKQITDSAGSFFTVGIPSIGMIRPLLFTTSQTQALPYAGTDTNAWDKTDADPAGWRAYVGAVIAGDVDTMALPFGVSGKDFAAFLCMVAIIGCMLIVVSSTGGFGALGSILLAVPILWLGTWFRMLPVALLVFTVLFFGLMAIRQLIIKPL